MSRGVASPPPRLRAAVSGPTCAPADERTTTRIRRCAHELSLAPAARKKGGEQGQQEPLGKQALTSQADRVAGRCKAPAGCP